MASRTTAKVSLLRRRAPAVARGDPRGRGGAVPGRGQTPPSPPPRPCHASLCQRQRARRRDLASGDEDRRRLPDQQAAQGPRLPPLRESGLLDRSAQGWTNTMVATGTFTHGADFAARISAVGFEWSSAGENIATGFLTPRAVVTALDGQHRALPEHPQPHVHQRRHRRIHRAVGVGAQRRDLDPGLRTGRRAAGAVGQLGPANGCPY